ncbi:MAG: hypothetical protein SFY68_09885 [Candidatus Sumerlaeia bacterium]|nr:hypothetical protein [Candidatus Sumerlaeia bacterium]
MILAPWGDIGGMTRFDAHPPGYYWLVKVVRDAAILFSLKEELALLRLPGLLVHLAMILGTAWGLKSLGCSKHSIALAVLLVGLNPYFADCAAELRNYAVVNGSVHGSFLLFAVLMVHRNSGFTRGIAAAWLAYSLLLAVGMWMHLLCGVVALVLGLAWLFVCCWEKGRHRVFLCGGILAHGGALILFFPWLLVMKDQLAYLSSANLSWMTPATIVNLIKCLSWSIPLAKSPWEVLDANELSLLGWILAFAVLGIPMWSLSEKIGKVLTAIKPTDQAERNEVSLLILGFWVWGGFILLTWFVSMLEVIRVFHANRYQAMVMGPGLMLLALLLARLREGSPRLMRFGVLVVSLVFGFSGGLRLSHPEFKSMLREFEDRYESTLPPRAKRWRCTRKTFSPTSGIGKIGLNLSPWRTPSGGPEQQKRLTFSFCRGGGSKTPRRFIRWRIWRFCVPPTEQ